MRKRKLHIAACLAALVLLFQLALPQAHAAGESIEVSIPVYAKGADCTAVLLDKTDTQLQSLKLTAGGSGTFKITCDGLGEHLFKVRLIDTDGGGVVYDKTVFTVKITVYYDSTDKIAYSIDASSSTTTAKPTRLEFVNSTSTPSCTDDPPVRKIVRGSPPRAATFTFLMTPNRPEYPMPVGTVDGVRSVSITGSGIEEFGVITFTEPGTYEYTIVERIDNLSGYTYDRSIYVARYTVTEVDGQLTVQRVLIKDGELQRGLTTATFTNVYGSGGGGGGIGPKTGDDSALGLWTALALLALCALIPPALILRRRR